jgi:hypothetical protein
MFNVAELLGMFSAYLVPCRSMTPAQSAWRQSFSSEMRTLRSCKHVKKANRCNGYSPAATGLFNLWTKREDNDQDP